MSTELDRARAKLLEELLTRTQKKAEYIEKMSEPEPDTHPDPRMQLRIRDLKLRPVAVPVEKSFNRGEPPMTRRDAERPMDLKAEGK